MDGTYDYVDVPIPFPGRQYMDAVFGEAKFPRGSDDMNKYIRAHRMGMPPEEVDSPWGRSFVFARSTPSAVASRSAKPAPPEPSASSPRVMGLLERVAEMPDVMGSKVVASLIDVSIRHLYRLNSRGLIHATRPVRRGSSRLRFAKAEVIRYLREVDGE